MNRNNAALSDVLRRFGAAGVLAVIVLVLVALIVDFLSRSFETRDRTETYPLAVVFTGDYARVHSALKLLEGRRVERLFVSGVNSGAGIQAESFQNRFPLTGSLTNALMDGRITLGVAAETTWQNALESACWLKAQEAEGPVLLVTSRWHLPRASLLLQRAVPDRVVLRYDGGGAHSGAAYALPEFRKYLVTRLLLLLPDAGVLMSDKATCTP